MKGDGRVRTGLTNINPTGVGSSVKGWVPPARNRWCRPVMSEQVVQSLQYKEIRKTFVHLPWPISKIIFCLVRWWPKRWIIRHIFRGQKAGMHLKKHCFLWGFPKKKQLGFSIMFSPDIQLQSEMDLEGPSCAVWHSLGPNGMATRWFGKDSLQKGSSWSCMKPPPWAVAPQAWVPSSEHPKVDEERVGLMRSLRMEVVEKQLQVVWLWRSVLGQQPLWE